MASATTDHNFGHDNDKLWLERVITRAEKRRKRDNKEMEKDNKEKEKEKEKENLDNDEAEGKEKRSCLESPPLTQSSSILPFSPISTQSSITSATSLLSLPSTARPFSEYQSMNDVYPLSSQESTQQDNEQQDKEQDNGNKSNGQNAFVLPPLMVPPSDNDNDDDDAFVVVPVDSVNYRNLSLWLLNLSWTLMYCVPAEKQPKSCPCFDNDLALHTEMLWMCLEELSWKMIVYNHKILDNCQDMLIGQEFEENAHYCLIRSRHLELRAAQDKVAKTTCSDGAREKLTSELRQNEKCKDNAAFIRAVLHFITNVEHYWQTIQNDPVQTANVFHFTLNPQIIDKFQHACSFIRAFCSVVVN